MDSEDFIPLATARPTDSNNYSSSNNYEDEGTDSHATIPLLNTLEVPWLLYSYDDNRAPPLIRLHNEILSFCEYIAPTRQELKNREKVLADITAIVRELFPTCSIHLFGSQLTKILTPTSDLDIALLGVPIAPDEEIVDVLYKLADRLEAANFVTYVEAIVGAKVPIVKFDHSVGISVDICVNNDSGLVTGKLIRQFVRDFPPMRPLTMVLKLFLAQRRLNDTYSGGMGSFVLSATVISFLQMKVKLAKFRQLQPNWNLGCLLLEYLQLYGSQFNYYTTAIRITNGGEYFAKRKRKHDEAFNRRPQLLFIENPTVPDLDMGSNSYMMPKIKRAFEHSNHVLTSALQKNNSKSYLAYIVRPDDPNLMDRPGPELNSAKTNADAMKEND